MTVRWHALEKNALIERLSSDEAWGLSAEAVESRFSEYGPNMLKRARASSPLSTIAGQFKSPLVIILIAAFLGAAYLGETVDATVIALALVVNIAIGFIQEYRAERAFHTLLESQERTLSVIRDGVRRIVRSAHIVPGDILLIEAGEQVSADAYILSASDLSVSEAHLTGESAPLEKHVGVLDPDTPVYERTNMLFSGSSVLTGSAKALTVATGPSAEIGAIAESLNDYGAAATPIEESVGRLARFLSLLVGVVVAILFVFGFARGMPLSDILILAIALAVSVVPQGLPAAVTAILAIGMEQILKQKGLVRNLLAAETLGSTTIILTDKTGTLTQARMLVIDLAIGSERGYTPSALSNDQRFLLAGAFRVSDAFTADGGKETYGRPVERAVASAALESAVTSEAEEGGFRRLDFLKFTSARRFAAALYGTDDGTGGRLYFSGAPDVLLKKATKYYEGGASHALGAAQRKKIAGALRDLATEGKRLIGVSFKESAAHTIERAGVADDLPKGTVFVGLIALADPARADVPGAIREVREAGVHVVMVTGDAPETAMSVARAVGIAHEEDQILIGSVLETMTDTEIYDVVMRTPVFARILPHQKQRLVTVLQDAGEVVAMTGDGVNDAPALQAAQIGVAVGSGTEVAREASDLILLDDSFAIIVAAIREGRRILDNIKKTIAHLITTSFHEVFLIAFAMIAGLPLPVLPVQILWVNILEEGTLSFGYAFEPAESDVMKRDPRSAHQKTVLTGEMKRLILIAGTVTGVFSTGLFVWLLSRGLPIEEVRTIIFVVLSLDALFFAASLKSLHRPVWTVDLFSNRYLIFALLISALGIVLTLAIAPVRNLLSLTVPNTFDLVVLFGVALVNIATIEFAKKIAFPSSVRMIQ